MSPTSRPSVIFGHTFAKLRVSSLALVLCIVSAVNVAFAAPASFDIPAQPAPAALDLFMKQSGTKVLFSNDDLKGVTTNPVAGQMEAFTALKKLVKGTGFEASQTDWSSFIVSREKVGAGTVQGSLSLPDGHPAMDAIVTVYETSQSTNADKEGRFSLTAVPAGTHVLVITSPECQTLHITDVHVRADEELTLANETLRKADEVAKLEPYEVSAQTIEQMEKYIVNDTNAKPPAFSDANVDIPRGIDDVQPYYILNAKTIEQSGATNINDFLKDYLPMDTLAQSNSQKYGTTNTLVGDASSVNLGGLGANQTLILIDGHRSAGISLGGPNATSVAQPDLNGIPLDAIDRIEVLPSSASAIYGGSAVGGVVNVILKKSYQGGEIQYTYDSPMDAHSPQRTVAATYGFSLEGGKTSVLMTGEYSDGEPLFTRDRSNLVNRGIATILANEPAYFYSSTSPFFGATPNVALYPGTVDGYSNPTNASLTLKNGTSLNSLITSIPAGTSPNTSPSTLDTGLLANAGTFNLELPNTAQEYGLLNPVIKYPTTKSLMLHIRRQMNSYLEAFVDLGTFTNFSQSAYNPFFVATRPVPGNAPDNPFQENVIVSFPTTLNLPQLSDSVTRSMTAGLIIKLPMKWTLEADYTWSGNSFDYVYSTYDSTVLASSLASGSVDPFVDTTLYPLNQAQTGVYPETYAGSSSLNDLALRGSGPIVKILWGDPVTLTFGLEHRKEGDDNANFYALDTPNPSDIENLTDLGQSESTDSAYAEIEIPLVSPRQRIALLQALDFQGAIRTEQYDVGTGTTYAYSLPGYGLSGYSGPLVHSEAKYTATKPMAGLSYKPVDEIILRASYATAFLPPTYTQLLDNPVESAATTTITDATKGKTYNVATVQNQNSNLTPQSSKDWDIGAIWEPKGELLKGLRFDLEFFQIKEFNVITSPPGGAQFIVNNASTYANRITRDATTGLITLVDTSSVNLYELETEGYDLSIDYRKNTSFGDFEMYGLGTISEHYKQQVSLTLPFLEYVGFPSEGGPSKVKANATLTWQFKRWTLGWSTQFFGSYSQAGAPGDPVYGVEYKQYYPNGYTYYTAAQGSNTIPSQIYHNIFLSYTFGKIGDKHSKIVRSLASDWTVQVGVKNVFNTLPPFDAYYAPYFYSPYGDPRLRDLWVSIKHDF